tara:strand:+ start:4786 stop:5385 length:600 start_codon:yes stop_codon:yes gene_type:complete
MKKYLKQTIDKIQEEISKDKGEIRLYSSKLAYYKGEPYSSGYFIYPRKKDSHVVIALGLDRKDYDSAVILIHEYCHYMQWKTQTEIWKKYEVLYNKYLDNEIEENDEELIKATVNMEAECEEMTSKALKDFSISEKKDRVKQVNAYLVFYQIFLETSKWYKNPPFENKDILDLMPEESIKEPLKYKIDKNLYELYKECL